MHFVATHDAKEKIANTSALEGGGGGRLASVNLDRSPWHPEPGEFAKIFLLHSLFVEVDSFIYFFRNLYIWLFPKYFIVHMNVFQ